MSDDDSQTVGGAGFLNPAPRRAPAGFFTNAAASVTGFAVALACGFRGEYATVMLEPRAVYPGVKCNFPGGPPECEPAACPVVRLALERVQAAVVRDGVDGLMRAGGRVFQRWFGEKKPPEGSG